MNADIPTQLLRIAILDDDEFIGQSIAFMAQTATPEVRLSTSPTAFFALTESWQPSHIILDLMMPEMDGVQVLSELGRRGCQAQLIITSGMDTRILEAARRSAQEHGLNIAGILAKPFTASALRQLLQPPAGVALDFPAKKTAPAKVTIDKPLLKKMLKKRELYVVYQPKVDCKSGILSGFEALSRWRHETHGQLPPERFIPKAESWGLIDELTHQVLDIALPWFADWCQRAQLGYEEESDPRDLLSLSINLSARTLRNTSFLDSIQARCSDLALNPARIIFELTETATMDDPVSALDLLTRLRMQGFRLSIDDFGTGYSSMLQLVRLPFSEVKVDKSFVITTAQSLESRMVIRSVVELAHSLGMTVTGEGVEDEYTLRYLQELHCDMAQGFFIAHPMAGEEIAAWYKDWQQSAFVESSQSTLR